MRSVPTLSAALAAALFAQAAAPADDVPTAKLNKKITGVTVTGPAGKPAALDAAAGKAATVVVFLWFDCPVSNSYAPVLVELAKTYADRGVNFVGVVPTDDSPAAVAKQVAEFKIPFPVYTDPALDAAASFKADTVPQAFVLDRHSVLRYRGRIDDGYHARLKKSATVQSHDLRDALDAVLAGKDVAKPATLAVGCPVGTKTPAAKPGSTAAVTYHRDVARILQTNCQGCHRPGQVGPFPLMTYRHAVSWADDIKEYTHSRKMPPWKPVGGPEYANARHMSEKDIATLATWVDAGCPEGDPKDAPAPVQYAHEWQLGPPDLVLEVPEDFHVGAAGRDVFRCFVIPTGLTEDKYITAFEVRPGNPRVVHHTLNFWDLSGQAKELLAEQRKKEKPTDQDRGPGYSTAMGIGFKRMPTSPRPGVPAVGGFGGWAPGQMATKLPPGAGFFLPGGADVIIQTHYHRTGKPETDRLKVGLYFAKGPVEKVWQSLSVQGMFPLQTIPAGAADYRLKGGRTLTSDAVIHSVMPHMHLLGKSVKVTMTPPGGTPVTLVDIPEWDYAWQETYWLKEPVTAKAGSRVEIEAVYDNSSSNPNNPSHPPVTVFHGEQTTNEMLFGFVGVTPVGAGRVTSKQDPPNLLPKLPFLGGRRKADAADDKKPAGK